VAFVDFRAEKLAHAAIQTSTTQQADFDFHHIEPARVFRCVMKLQALKSAVCLAGPEARCRPAMMYIAGLGIRPPFYCSQMAFHQIERRMQDCQCLPGQGRLRVVLGIAVQRGDDCFLARYTYRTFTDVAPSHVQQCLAAAAHLVGSPA
jgi:hypothetical protein